jgi:alpha-L-arabinofuranosidase
MKPTVQLACAAAFALTSFTFADATLSVDVSKPGISISPSLYGIFFEEINYAGDGGIYPELLRNRNFEDNADRPEFWSLVLADGARGDAALGRSEGAGEFNQHHIRLSRDAESKGLTGIANDGYWGVPVRKNGIYRLTIRARSKDVTRLAVSIQNRDGVVYANTEVNPTWNEQAGFQQSTMNLTSTATDPNARLVLSIDQPGSVDIDYVSLMPTNEIANGVVAPNANSSPARYRNDLFEKLHDLKPAFMRFPGGCWVEGETMATASRWKRTVGPLHERWTQPNLWGYRSTNGLGYHEYLQMCEDLGASALFVINVGMSHREVVPMDKMGEYVQDALDAIEYALGPVDSKYGKMRADAGHPEPFRLDYLQIGNENGGTAYNERYALFYDAIKARYPQIKTIACDWGGQPTSRSIDIIDEHYYNTPQFFFRNAHKYDSYERPGTKVYVGEYAVTQGSGAGNLIGALGEAAFMTGMERNSDVVVMASYAPLFAHVSGKRWNPDMINFDSSRSYGTPSFYVQKLFAQNRGDVVLPVDLKVDVAPTKIELKGSAGVGTWSTQAQFKDFKVTGADGKVLYESSFANAEGWNFSRQRSFSVRDGVLTQRGSEEDTRATVGEKNWTDYTVEVKARKTGGDEGFLVLARANANDDYVWFNVGGWGNTRTSIERTFEGAKEEIGKSADFRVENDRWYDLKLEVKGDEIRGYVDGKLLSTAKDARTPMNKVFATASQDKTSGEVILKLVNGSETSHRTKIVLSGMSSIATATGEVLSGKPGDENTLDAPTRVSPRPAAIELRGSGGLNYEAPAYSVTVLRIKGG